jgi:hypothetical protein
VGVQGVQKACNGSYWNATDKICLAQLNDIWEVLVIVLLFFWLIMFSSVLDRFCFSRRSIFLLKNVMILFNCRMLQLSTCMIFWNPATILIQTAVLVEATPGCLKVSAG